MEPQTPYIYTYKKRRDGLHIYTRSVFYKRGWWSFYDGVARNSATLELRWLTDTSKTNDELPVAVRTRVAPSRRHSNRLQYFFWHDETRWKNTYRYIIIEVCGEYGVKSLVYVRYTQDKCMKKKIEPLKLRSKI